MRVVEVRSGTELQNQLSQAEDQHHVNLFHHRANIEFVHNSNTVVCNEDTETERLKVHVLH